VFRDALAEIIYQPEFYKKLIDDGTTKIKYVLTGTLMTNGHELRVLAYSLTTPKPPTHPVPNTTRQKLPDVKAILATVDQVRDVFPYNGEHVVVGIDPGIHNTATATIMDSNEPNEVRNFSIPQSASAFCTKAYMKQLH